MKEFLEENDRFIKSNMKTMLEMLFNVKTSLQTLETITSLIFALILIHEESFEEACLDILTSRTGMTEDSQVATLFKGLFDGIERKNDTINFNKFGTRLREIYDEIHKKNLAIF